MTTIATQNVEVRAEVGDTDFRVTAATVTRGTGKTIGSAEVKGLLYNEKRGVVTNNSELEDTFQKDAEVRVFVTAKSEINPEETTRDLLADGVIFSGRLDSVKQNEEGIITVSAYDTRHRLQNINVQFVTETEIGPRKAIELLLTGGEANDSAYDSITSNLADAQMKKPYVSANLGRNEDVEPVRQWEFGTTNRKESLISALNHVLGATDAEIWVDRNGILRIESAPERQPWETPLITEVNAGEDSRNASSVIVEGGNTASQLSIQSQYLSPEQTATGEAEITADQREAPEKEITAPGAITREEIDNRAMREAKRQQQQRNMGSVTIIGNAEIDLIDQIIIPDSLEYDLSDITGQDTSEIDEAADGNFFSGKYKVDGLTHKIDAQNGFLTEIQLAPSLEQTYEEIEFTLDNFRQNALERDTRQEEEPRQSGTEGSSGLLQATIQGFVAGGVAGPIGSITGAIGGATSYIADENLF